MSDQTEIIRAQTIAPRMRVLALRSQIAILKPGRGQHRKYLPNAFTEHGALMAANILNSPRAVAMSVYVIRAFVKMREDLAANSAILRRLAEIDKTLLIHDSALRDIYQKLRPLLKPPPAPFPWRLAICDWLSTSSAAQTRDRFPRQRRRDPLPREKRARSSMTRRDA